MTWTQLTTLKIGRSWQFTPEIARNLGWIRLKFATAGVPLLVAQVDLETEDVTSTQQIMATVRRQVIELPAPPEFTKRALALRSPNHATSFDVTIEVSDMPYISSGSTPPPVTPPPPIQTAASASVTTVDASVQAVNLLEANPDRKKLIVINSSAAIMYLAFGEVASPTNHTIAIGADGDGYELADFTGVVSAIWTEATGKALITEFE